LVGQIIREVGEVVTHPHLEVIAHMAVDTQRPTPFLRGDPYSMTHMRVLVLGKYPAHPARRVDGDRAFDSHAAVCSQVTFNGQQSNADEALVNDLMALADLGAIGLVVHGSTTRVGGVRRGWVYQPATGQFPIKPRRCHTRPSKT